MLPWLRKTRRGPRSRTAAISSLAVVLPADPGDANRRQVGATKDVAGVAGQRQPGIGDDHTGDTVVTKVDLALAEDAGRAAGHGILNEVVAVSLLSFNSDEDRRGLVVAWMGPRRKQARVVGERCESSGKDRAKGCAPGAGQQIGEFNHG